MPLFGFYLLYLQKLIKEITMATNVGDFFIGSNSVYNITDEDYQKSTF